MSRTLDRLIDRFLDHHFAFHPVDASFMGVAGHDGRLPRSDANAIANEDTGLAAIAADLASIERPTTSAARVDRRLLESQIAVARATLARRPHVLNPAWHSGEAVFSIISLLLPQSDPTQRDAVRDRLRVLPDFLADGAARLKGEAIPAGWRKRAQQECRVFARFLASDLQTHPAFDSSWRDPALQAARALETFSTAIDGAPDRDFAAGRDHLALLMQTGHGFDSTPEEAEADAEEAFARLGAELEDDAARIDRTRSWREQIAALADKRPPNDDVDAAYRYWHERAMADASHLVTPATDYELSFDRLPPCFAAIAPETYFLSYRSPPLRAGRGSVYWIPGPAGDEKAWLSANNPTTIKIIHAVHHGSVGHHTQNARARIAPSRLARLAATDCALALGFFPAGAMAEGWACYVMGLMRECPDFYEPAELLVLKQHERRDAASVLVDIRLHTGRWSAAEAARFYREEAGFAPSRVDGEIVRNSMFPGSRLMYRLGAETIRAMRRQWRGDVRDFHDRLIGFGSIPPGWAVEEMAAAAPIQAKAI